MKKLITLSLIFILMSTSIVMLCSCGESGTDNKEEVIRISTPYCDLCVPDSFEENVVHKVTSEDPYKIAFKTASDDVNLFELSFNKATSDLLGTLILDDENVIIYVDFAELDKDSKNYSENVNYQEAVNTIITHLSEDYEFVIGEAVEQNADETFEIETSLTTLNYPKKWEDVVKVDVEEDRVRFSFEDEKLFDLCFYECDGFLLGTYDKTPIYVISYEIDEENYKEAEYMEISGMQQAVNVIIDHLMEDKKFVMSE